MIRRVSEHLVLRPEDLKPLRDDFTVIGVFNPGAVQFDDNTYLLARVAEKPRAIRPGLVGLPRWEKNGHIVVDWVPEDDFDCTDPRVVRHKGNHLLRLTSVSHLRAYRSRDGRTVEELPGATLLPESATEEFGLEDPRIAQIEGKFWITYAAVSRRGVATALASTDDWVTFVRHGLIFCPENKDVVLFPRKVQGQFASLHRPSPHSCFGRPQMWLARSPDLLHWGRHEWMHGGRAEWESVRVGAGTPPIELEEGWLEVYHGSSRAARAGDVGAYAAGALLLDLRDPARVLRRSHEPIMQAAADFERAGFVPNVVFPTGIIRQGDTLHVYYGACDTCIGTVEFSLKELLAALH